MVSADKLLEACNENLALRIENERLRKIAAENYEELNDAMREAWGHTYAAVKLDKITEFLHDASEHFLLAETLRQRNARLETALERLATAAGKCRRGTKTVKFKSVDYCMRHDNPEPCPVGLARVKYGVDE